LIEACGPERYCIASPSLLRLTIDVLAAGSTSDQALQLLSAIADAAERVAVSAERLLPDRPTGSTTPRCVVSPNVDVAYLRTASAG
jgi:hypothetical protein